jgi:uncharacterized protein YigE (DUF2233 family)
LKQVSRLLLLATTIGFIGVSNSCSSNKKKPESNTPKEDERFITRIVNVQNEDLKLYWKNDRGEIINNFSNLKSLVESKRQTLLFAMNGGMFNKDFSPQGLFIEQQVSISPLDTSSGDGNFYLKPNGVFYITTDNKAQVCQTTDFIDNGNIKYATQSGPMLVINGEIHPVFKQGSTNLHIRNGVGILPDNNVIFAMSKDKINLYDFASYFQSLGCKNALYLDGFVSRTYLPEKNWVQTDGKFGVMIGVTKQSNEKKKHQHTYNDEFLNICDGKSIVENTIVNRFPGEQIEFMFAMDGRYGEITVYENDEKGKTMIKRKLTDGFSYENIYATDYPDGKYICVLKRDKQISKIVFRLVTIK